LVATASYVTSLGTFAYPKSAVAAGKLLAGSSIRDKNKSKKSKLLSVFVEALDGEKKS
jgi:hypothetical protein